MPVSEFAEGYLERYARHCKPATPESGALVVRKYILPALGHLAVDEIAFEHVRDRFAFMANRTTTASRSMSVVSAIMRLAERWG